MRAAAGTCTPPARAVGRLAVTAGVLALSLPAVSVPARAQAGTAGGGLDSVAAALDSGRVEAARAALERWIRENAPEAPGRLRARARLLRARLAEDPEAARRAYTRLALEGGPEGAEARLRLAQLRLARGQHDRALEELALLRADYPGGAPAAEAWLWIGRVREAADDADAACRAYRTAEEKAAEAGAAALVEAAASARAACEDGAPAGGEGATFSVQLGAFSTLPAAVRLRDRVRGAGFDARVVPPRTGEGLHRVRAGGASGRAGAEELAGRLERLGFSAIVVSVGGNASSEGGS